MARLAAEKGASSRKRFCSQGVTAFGARRAPQRATKRAPSRKRLCSQRVTAFRPREPDRAAPNAAPSRKRLCSQEVRAFGPRRPDLAAPNAAPSRKRLCSQGFTAFSGRMAARAAKKRPRRVNAFVRKELRYLSREEEDAATWRGVTSRKRLCSQEVKRSATKESKQSGEKTETAFQCLREDPTPER